MGSEQLEKIKKLISSINFQNEIYANSYEEITNINKLIEEERNNQNISERNQRISEYNNDKTILQSEMVDIELTIDQLIKQLDHLRLQLSKSEQRPIETIPDITPEVRAFSTPQQIAAPNVEPIVSSTTLPIHETPSRISQPTPTIETEFIQNPSPLSSISSNIPSPTSNIYPSINPRIGNPSTQSQIISETIETSPSINEPSRSTYSSNDIKNLIENEIKTREEYIKNLPENDLNYSFYVQNPPHTQYVGDIWIHEIEKMNNSKVRIPPGLGYEGTNNIAKQKLQGKDKSIRQAKIIIPEKGKSALKEPLSITVQNPLELNYDIDDIITSFRIYGINCSKKSAQFIQMNLLSYGCIYKISLLALAMQKHTYTKIPNSTNQSYRRATPTVTRKVLSIYQALIYEITQPSEEAYNFLQETLNMFRLGKNTKNYLGRDFNLINRPPVPKIIKDKNTGEVLNIITDIPIERQVNTVIYS